MCTASFLPTGDGFIFATNRDESRSRPVALPPANTRLARDRRALYPREETGGTWIGVNDAGLLFALMNWYAQPKQGPPARISRGLVIPRLLRGASLPDAKARLPELPLEVINPFRLVAISLSERRLETWRWDGKTFDENACPWSRQHWFSSGLDEQEAGRVRARVCAAAPLPPAARPLGWLRELHRSHQPEIGPFSICMHRREAATVSCTDVRMNSSWAQMTYQAGSPCARPPRFVRRLRLASPARTHISL